MRLPAFGNQTDRNIASAGIQVLPEGHQEKLARTIAFYLSNLHARREQKSNFMFLLN